MVVFKKFVRRHNRTAKILLSTVIGLSMAVFTFIPFSAEEYIYTPLDNINLAQFVNNVSYRLTIDNISNFSSSDTVFYLTDTAKPTFHPVNISNLPYSLTTFSQGQDFSCVPFVGITPSGHQSNEVPGLRLVSSIDFGFNYYFTDFVYEFYVLIPRPYQDSNTNYSFSLYYLDKDGNINTFSNYTYSIVESGNRTVQDLASLYPDIVGSYYSNIYSQYKYIYGSSVPNSTFVTHLVKVSINEHFSDYESISQIGFSLTYLSSCTLDQLNNKKLGFNIHLSPTLSNGYILTSATQEYIRMLTEVNEKLDVVTGSPSQQQQAAIDQVDNQLATEYDELQEQLDIIHSPEMPTELPTEDFSNLETQANIIDSYLGDLNLLNIFNVIVPAGCAGFLIYIVLRRF